MIEKSKNKMISKEDTKQKYSFPDYGITIEANSIEEAELRLQEIIIKKSND